jgi:outer membrane receptor protein involved in Fe transport
MGRFRVAPLLVLLFAARLASAQTITATVRGTVRDTQGGVLPGVSITASSGALGLTQSTRSGSDGTYVITGLTPGTYQIRAELAGFQTTVLTDVQLSIRSLADLDVTMELASVAESITVKGQADVVETSRSDVRVLIDQHTIESIPLNGRHFTDLVALGPGVSKDPGGTDFSVFGERPTATTFLTDGIENSDSYTGSFAQHFNQDAIQEFEVNLTGYMPEFGRGNAGAINIITRSGTNDLAGTGFYYMRRDALDSSNVPNTDVPKLTRDNPGVTLGGPIKRTRSWFFYAYEFNDEDRGTNFGQIANLISETVRQGYFTTTGRTNGAPSPENFTTLTTSQLNSHFGKATVNLGTQHTLSVQTNVDRRKVFGSNLLAGQPKGDENDPLLPSGADSVVPHSFSISANDTHIFSGRSLLDSRFRFLDLHTDKNTNRIGPQDVTLPNVRLFTAEGQFQTSLSTRELNGIGSRTDRQFEWAEAFSHVRGPHTIKAGGGYKRQALSGFFLNPFNIGFTQAQLISSGAIIPLLGSGGFEIDGFRNINSSLTGATAGREQLDMDNNIWGIFVQDAWKISDSLTLNAGVRYDWESLFSGDKNNVSPRLGLVWDPLGDGKTAVRASTGIYYDKNVLNAVEQVPEFGGVANGRGGDTFMPKLGYTWGLAMGPAYETWDSLSPQQVFANPATFDLVSKDILMFLFMVNGNGPNIGLRQLASAVSGDPLAVYKLLGISVTDPAHPPTVNFDNISQLTGGALSPEQALALLNGRFPGAHFIWTPFASPLIGGRVISFEGFPGIDPTGARGYFQGLETPIRTPVTYGSSVGIERQLFGNMSAQFEYVHRNTNDILVRRDINLVDDPQNATGLRGTHYALGGAAAGQAYQQLGYAGITRYRGVILSLTKRYSNNYYYRLSYTYSRAKDNVTTDVVDARNSFTDANHPMFDYGRSTRAIPHVFVGSGAYTFPYQVTISSVLTWRSGRPFTADGVGDYDGDGFNDFFDTRTSGRGAFSLPAFVQWDLRAAKDFRVSRRNTITVIGEVFNVTNRDNAAQVIGAFDSANFRQPIIFFPGREVQLAVRLTF